MSDDEKKARDLVRKEIFMYLKQIEDDRDKEAVKAELLSLIEKEESDNIYIDQLKQYNETSVAFMTAQFMGMPEGFDAKGLLRPLPISLLLLLQQAFDGGMNPFPSNLIHIELMYRSGKIMGDWTFTRESETKGTIETTLPTTLSYIGYIFDVPEKKTN